MIQKFRARLVHMFKYMFSVFKQYYTFSPKYIFKKTENNLKLLNVEIFFKKKTKKEKEKKVDDDKVC